MTVLPARPDAPAPSYFTSFDGRRIAYRDAGEGPPVLLLHGIMSDAAWAWFGPGHAARLVAHGRRVIAPDFRGHSASDAPRDAEAYAGEAMVRDVEALLRELRVTDPDVAGYSMGGRVAIRWMVRGARPRRAVLGGVGDALVMGTPLLGVERFERLLRTEGRSGRPDDAAAWAWMGHGGFDPHAMLAVVRGLEPTSERELASISTPALVVLGTADDTVGSPERLAALLGRASVRRIPGDHVQAGLSRAFGDAVIEFIGT